MKCELPCEELLKVSSLLPINLPFSSENVYLLSSETCVSEKCFSKAFDDQ